MPKLLYNLIVFLFTLTFLISNSYGQGNNLVFEENIHYEINSKSVKFNPPNDRVWIIEDISFNNSKNNISISIDNSNKLNLTQIRNSFIVKKQIQIYNCIECVGHLEIIQYKIEPKQLLLIDDTN